MACTCSFIRLRRLRRLAKLLVVLLICLTISYFVFILINRIDFALKNGSGGNIFTMESKHSNLTLSVWRNVCSEEVEVLKKSPFYPRFPEEKKLVKISGFFVEDNSREYGQTITGFIHSRKSGTFRFAIASDDSSELWLSPSEDPKEKRLIARVFSTNSTAWTRKNELKKYPSQISKDVNLRNGSRYYIEVIHKQGDGDGFVQVFWEGPGDTGFKLISSEFISPYSDNITATSTKEALSKMLFMRLAISESAKQKYLYFLSLPFIGERNYLPSCTYKSSFIVEEQIKIGRYNGQNLVHVSNVFPKDDTFMGNRSIVWSWRNRVADAEIVQSVVDKMIAALYTKTSKKYFLKRIEQVMQKPDPIYGDRFLVDLEVGLRDTNQSFRLSEHVYQKKGSAKLCLPQEIRWNNKATVYFIIPVKNQGKWVYHFINELTFASLVTGDTNFHVIVVDFKSEDINMTEAFQTPLLNERHTIVNLTGKFHKTLALNEGANQVPGKKDILLLFDLHIDVPVSILETVRKNTIEGRIAYFPIVGRLECGSTSEEHKGFWEMEGYGLVSIYKSDWARFGGMNTEDYKYKWGGEDWDLLDRVMNARLEVERFKLPGLYHHYHSKYGMWN